MERLSNLVSCMRQGLQQRLSFDLSLARGLDYYTGVIFEDVLVNESVNLGSIGAGGRHDSLVGMFRKQSIPCCGCSLGIERIMNVMMKETEEEAKKNSADGKGKVRATVTDVMVGTIEKWTKHPKSVPPRRTNAVRACAPVSSSVPDSFKAACEEARSCMLAALSGGQRRLFVDLDTTNGDESYTTLKTTTPTVLELTRAFDAAEGSGNVQVAFPDSGAAALAKRDWGDELNREDNRLKVVGLEQYKRNADDVAVVVVVPRASEVDLFAFMVKEAGDWTVVVMNPDLVDMGVTGLSLNAQRLRKEVIDTFDSVFYLRVSPWGVLLRRFPGAWEV